MSFRFRKSFKIFPGIRLNVGRKTSSFTIGKRGASINIGERGIYSNLGVKGTGISYRSKIAGASQEGGKRVSRASKINQLEKLEKMYSKGQVSELEYLRLKNELLNDHIVQPKRAGCLRSVIQFVMASLIVIFILAMCATVEKTQDTNKSSEKQSILYQLANNEDKEAESEELSTKQVKDVRVKDVNDLICEKLSPDIMSAAHQAIHKRASLKQMSDIEYAKNIGYVYLDTLIEDVAMAKGVGMNHDSFLEKREQFPNINKKERTFEPKCDFKMSPMTNEERQQLENLF